MGGSRTAEDRLLALLALHPYPLSQRAIAEELEIDRSKASRLCGECLAKGSIIVSLAPSTGRSGPPLKLYALPGVPPAPTPPPVPVKFEPDTMVITPMNRTARVLKVSVTGYADLEVIGEKDRELRFITVHTRLLHAFIAGRPRPDPVRIRED